MAKADFQQLNGIALAYLGDAVYEVYVREHLLYLGMSKPNRLQKKATSYVSAKAQAGLIKLMEDQDKLTDEEWKFFKRGRNANSYTHAKHTSVITYRISTGFEALMGYLKLSGQQERLNELCTWCIKQVDLGRIQYEQ